MIYRVTASPRPWNPASSSLRGSIRNRRKTPDGQTSRLPGLPEQRRAAGLNMLPPSRSLAPFAVREPPQPSQASVISATSKPAASSILRSASTPCPGVVR